MWTRCCPTFGCTEPGKNRKSGAAALRGPWARGRAGVKGGAAVMTADELLFFDRLPRFLPVYAALKDALAARHPGMTVRVARTQISFRSRYVFAMVSLPRRRFRGWPKEYLLVSFGLPEQRVSPRIAASAEACPGRWTHHVPVEQAGELDAQLLGWLEEAWQFSLVK